MARYRILWHANLEVDRLRQLVINAEVRLAAAERVIAAAEATLANASSSNPGTQGRIVEFRKFLKAYDRRYTDRRKGV